MNQVVNQVEPSPSLSRAYVVIASLIVAASLLLVALCAHLGAFPKTSGHVSALYPAQSELLSNLRQAERLYGRTQTDSIVVSFPRGFDATTQDLVYLFEEELAALEGIQQIQSPMVGLSSNPPPLRLLSADQSAGRFLVTLENDLSDVERELLNQQINELVEGFPELGATRAGAFFLSQAVTKTVREESERILPICAGVLLIVLTLLLRSFSLALRVMIVPGLTLLWITFGGALLGVTLGPISQLAPPMLLAIAASYSVHVTARLRGSSRETYQEALHELRHSISLAALTTVSGLLSLCLIEVHGVTEFALMAAAGVVIAALFSLTLIPPLVIPLLLKNHHSRQYIFSFNPESLVRGGLVAVVLAVVSVFSFGLGLIEVHTDPLMFLPKTSPELRHVWEARAQFPGNHLLSVSFEPASVESSVLQATEFQSVGSLAKQIQRIPGVVHTVSAADYQAFLAHAKQIGLDSFSVLGASNWNWGPPFITTRDGQATRIIVETDFEGAELLALAEQIKKLVAEQSLRQSEMQKLRASVSSVELLIADQSSRIVTGITRSLVCTLLMISVLLFVLFRSIRLVAIGLVPNVLPIVVILGSIGLFYRDMNFGTALVASAALSIAVDNTFHLLIGWRMSSGALEAKERAVQALRIALDAFLVTSLVLIATFLVMANSEVVPVSQFGLLFAIALSVGLGADIVVLPFFLSKVAPGGWSKKRDI